MAATQKKQINLLRGWPNPALLPTPAIHAAATAALTDPKVSAPALLYGPDPGYQPLRESVARWLGKFHGRDGDGGAERVCISGGASQGLACLLQVWSDPGVTRVWMVAPCYFLACPIFEDAGLRVRGVGEGESGIDLQDLERRLSEDFEKRPIKRTKPWAKVYTHIIYCVPTFSNPSGQTMNLATRESLVRLARKYDALIITDDVYDFLQWPISTPGAAAPDPSTLTHALLPRLIDVDHTLEPVPGPDDYGNVVGNGSFSKIAGPGMRTGWAEATPKFIYGLSQCGSTRSGGAPSQFTAAVVDSLLSSGALSEHIEKVLKPAYQQRHAFILSAIKQHLAPLGVSVREGSLKGSNVFGGYFVWLTLPKGVDANVLAMRCKEEENLVIAPGKMFQVQGDERFLFPSEVRLCFSHEELDDLEKGVKRMAGVLGRLLENGSVASRGGDAITKEDLGEFK